MDCLQRCVVSLQHCFWSSGLLLNPDKSSVMFFGTSARLRRSDLPKTVDIAMANLTVSEKLRILGVTLDGSLTMDGHVSETVKSCNYHLQALRHLRQSVTREVANSMACSIINTRLDYCNSLFRGVSEKNISKLQRIRNRAARIVCNVGRRELSSKELLIDLHWLPVRCRVEFKTAALCFKAY